MKTFHPILLIAGLIVLSSSCKTSSKNKSRESISIGNNIDSFSATPDSVNESQVALTSHLKQVVQFLQEKGYSTEYCFLIDMGICSGKNRFFVYDIMRNTVTLSGLVAHGNCNTQFLEEAKFSNKPNCGCSSLGKYKVGASYRGEFGKSYRLYGLDSTNSNAFKRAIVAKGSGMRFGLP